MNNEEMDNKIAEAAKTIFSYSRARTDTREDAEDLAQEILLELLKSQHNIRDEKAFYGFMWAVAGNVYKKWCRKRANKKFLELDEDIPNDTDLDEQLMLSADLAILRREMCLLGERHRKVTIAYYFYEKSVSDISKAQCLSESMVKYLLFKTRQILKGGMNMDREYGELSYNPRKLMMCKWGPGLNRYGHLLSGNLTAQNILMACYNEACTEQELSLQIGVAVPYLEKDLKVLCEHGVLKKTGSKYLTDIVIFSQDYSTEVDMKTQETQKEIASRISLFLDENESQIRDIGFTGSDRSINLYRWHIAAMILEIAVFRKFQGSLQFKYPKTIFGDDAFVWVEEIYENYSGGHHIHPENKAGDMIIFHDFRMLKNKFGSYFNNNPNRTNILLDIAGGSMAHFSENDIEEVAGFIRLGLVRKENDRVIPNFPVFSKAQYDALSAILEPVTALVAEKTAVMSKIATEILIQHTPVYLKEAAANMGWLKMLSVAVTGSLKILLDSGYINPPGQTEVPTAYIVLAN